MYYLIKDAKIYYEIIGEGMPILMLHGCSPDHNLMTGCMEPYFSKTKGFQRIYIDLPGMGKSDAPNWIKNSNDILTVILSFIKEIIKDRHFLIAGESYGGYLARGVLLHYKKQMEGMFLLCPVIKPVWGERKCPNHKAIIEDEVFLDSLSEDQKNSFCEGAVVRNEYVYRRFMNEINVGLEVANTTFIKSFQKQYSFPFDVDHFPDSKFEKPVLIVTGRQDSCVGYTDQWDVIEHYPRATYASLDMSGHNLQIENPVLFHHLLDDWIYRVKAYKP